MPDDKPSTEATMTEPMSAKERCCHGWRGARVEGVIKDRCPECGGQVFVGEGGRLTCAYLDCRNPDVWDAWDNKIRQAEAAAETARDREWIAGISAGIAAVGASVFVCYGKHTPADTAGLIEDLVTVAQMDAALAAEAKGREEAIEECARLLEDEVNPREEDNPVRHLFWTGAAHYLRALKEKADG